MKQTLQRGREFSYMSLDRREYQNVRSPLPTVRQYRNHEVDIDTSPEPSSQTAKPAAKSGGGSNARYGTAQGGGNRNQNRNKSNGGGKGNHQGPKNGWNPEQEPEQG
ncbi:MAG: hypothetical protein LIO70_07505 [Clostridiales bacterium]|nr:hypothetical protein [Clostridiales bacterium]